MPSCSASESDSKYAGKFSNTAQTACSKLSANPNRRGCLQVADSLFTSSPALHRLWTNRISKYSISTSGHSRMDPFGPDFERYKTLEGHLHDRGANYASFPSSAATDCASSERIRTCTRSSETILLRSWIATAADCVSFSGLFFRIRSINC